MQSAIILAASRKQEQNVFLREVLFCPVVALCAQTCINANISDIYVIINDNEDEAAFKEAFKDFSAVKLINATDSSTKSIVLQIAAIANNLEANSDILLLRGDIPFIDEKVIMESYDFHKKSETQATVLTTQGGDENRSAVWLCRDALKSALSIECDFPQRCPLHLLPDLLFKNGKNVASFFANNEEFSLRASSSKDIFALNQLLNKRVIEKHIEKGVEFLSTDGILIGQNVTIGSGSQILPGTILKGDTTIADNCIIGPNSLLENCTVGNFTKFNASQGYNSTIGCHVTIGPFCHIRPNSIIKDNVHLGDFVEIKNSTIGDFTHVSHLTYVGDSDVGERVNFGCGVVTVNYNGKTKARCTIDDDAFIGCNTNLVAPVHIQKSGYTAAGSTITQDVPQEALAIARARQINKEEYNKKLR